MEISFGAPSAPHAGGLVQGNDEEYDTELNTHTGVTRVRGKENIGEWKRERERERDREIVMKEKNKGKKKDQEE